MADSERTSRARAIFDQLRANHVLEDEPDGSSADQDAHPVPGRHFAPRSPEDDAEVAPQDLEVDEAGGAPPPFDIEAEEHRQPLEVAETAREATIGPPGESVAHPEAPSDPSAPANDLPGGGGTRLEEGIPRLPGYPAPPEAPLTPPEEPLARPEEQLTRPEHRAELPNAPITALEESNSRRDDANPLPTSPAQTPKEPAAPPRGEAPAAAYVPPPTAPDGERLGPLPRSAEAAVIPAADPPGLPTAPGTPDDDSVDPPARGEDAAVAPGDTAPAATAAAAGSDVSSDADTPPSDGDAAPSDVGAALQPSGADADASPSGSDANALPSGDAGAGTEPSDVAELAGTLAPATNDAAAGAPTPPTVSPETPVPAPEEAASTTSGRPPHPGSLHELPRRFAVANQKGGVGKTTTAVNLGAALAELGYRVLIVDLDPQGNATTGLGINTRNLESSVYDVILHDAVVEDVVEPTSLRNLFVAPATIDLAGAEIELVPLFSRELRLRRALDTVADDFDFVFIDCPPSLGLLTVNGLAAATEVVVPIQCEYYALEGLGQLLRNVNLVQSNLNGDLDVSTIVLTMYDARTRLAEQVASEVREHFGDRVCRNVVPRTVRLSEAPSYGQPIVMFDPSSRGAIAYRELAKEVSGGAPQRTR